MELHAQPVPIRVYESDKRVMVAAPLPGLEPTDISVAIHAQTVSISGDYRGPLKEDPALLAGDPTNVVLAEWEPGPYYREISLPHAVDGALTNATFGNGVLVLVMPKHQAAASVASPAEFRLEVVEASRGERVGHAGRDIHPMTTAEHRQRAHHHTAQIL